MLFSSMTFISIFLPIVIILYFAVNDKLKNAVLLLASILFYAWGEPRYLAILFLTILVNYAGALLIDKENIEINRKILLAVTIIINLSFLVYFKYFNFLVDNINLLFHSNIDFIRVVMPIGISFYTFQALSYVVDVYRKEVQPQKNIYNLALYICMFPQLVAGPIVKYHDVAEQIENREVTFDNVSIGAKRFICGLSKKVLIANTMGAIADKIFAQQPDVFSPLIAWIGAFAYSFQLFFDFSGYSDMAIGLGLIFGFKYLENFNFPYISKSISEFWRRWHISLSTWFKQYVYIPLGGNRQGINRTCLNLGIVFLLTGIWHGASWTFVVWGIWNGFFIIVEKITGWNNETENKNINIIKHIYTIFVFVMGWVLFRSETLHYALQYIKNMFGLVKVHDIAYALPYYIDNTEVIMFIVAVLMSMPLFNKWLYVKGKKSILLNIWLLVLFVLSISSISASTYNPFIYFRF